MVATVAREEIQFHPASTGRDADGRLFEWQGKLLRGIAPANAADYARLLNSGVYGSLADRGAVVTAARAEVAVDGFDLVVEHERLPRVSYPFEWSWPMLRDAGLAVLDVSLELLGDGYIVKDPSSWNVLFVGTRPVYVDFSNVWAVDRIGYAWTSWPEWFRSYYTYPLRLVAEGKSRAVRRLAHDYERGISRDEMIELGLHVRERAEREARRLARAALNRARSRRRRGPVVAAAATPLTPAGVPYHAPERWADLLRGLRDELSRVDVPIPKTKWSGYYDLSLSPNAPAEGLTDKHRNVEHVLDELRPDSVVDIGAATGWFSKLAAAKGAEVVVLEADESAVARLYRDAKAESLSILPLVMSIAEPTASYGLVGSRVASASERLDGDLALALAVVHHLALGQGVDFDHIVESLRPFARRHLLVEWIDRTDETLLGWFAHVTDWYTEDAFRTALERHFEIRDVLPSHPGTRRLYFCERR